ncbi:type II toxin-antitoxin system ParD family antitoxin [Blastomonas sp. AAP53]|uniref:type II toxin-antitoxin system ParD family antitoxin n=1 Tax=Blastomonas sp. AAP53 TaxID=1248760 RepID=UPI000306D200|nr:type II toxin-antitoxin system ParD family antitoxin [Blastomonas sp. AAP53]
MEKASITLTEAHHQMLHAAIEAGEYASISEAIRDALRGWEIQRRVREAELEDLRREIQKGIDDIEAGRVVAWDPEAMKQRLRAKFAQ